MSSYFRFLSHCKFLFSQLVRELSVCKCQAALQNERLAVCVSIVQRFWQSRAKIWIIAVKTKRDIFVTCLPVQASPTSSWTACWTAPPWALRTKAPRPISSGSTSTWARPRPKRPRGRPWRRTRSLPMPKPLPRRTTTCSKFSWTVPPTMASTCNLRRHWSLTAAFYSGQMQQRSFHSGSFRVFFVTIPVDKFFEQQLAISWLLLFEWRCRERFPSSRDGFWTNGTIFRFVRHFHFFLRVFARTWIKASFLAVDLTNDALRWGATNSKSFLLSVSLSLRMKHSLLHMTWFHFVLSRPFSFLFLVKLAWFVLSWRLPFYYVFLIPCSRDGVDRS